LATSQRKKNKTKTIQRIGNIQEEEKQNKNNPENWQHRVYKTKKNKTKTIQRIGNIQEEEKQNKNNPENWQHRVYKTKKKKQSRELAT
jgi:CRISPR/Cas system CSM-associated protein Csm2 small subunit